MRDPLLDQLGGIWEIIFWITLPEPLPNWVEEELLSWHFAIQRGRRAGAGSVCKEAIGIAVTGSRERMLGRGSSLSADRSIGSGSGKRLFNPSHEDALSACL
jgi:hypothetical protein